MSSSSTSSTTDRQTSQPSSKAGSPTRPVERAAVFTHGKRERVADAVERLENVAAEAGVELVSDDADGPIDLAIVLGGDGTMLRALTQFLGTGIPAFGVNFGRVGFLTSIGADELEAGVRRAFAGDLDVAELATLDVQLNGERRVAVNDAVVASANLGRMIELGYAIRDEDLGTQPCDGLICATPSGSTAYNLSNGGPVLVWGLEAMVLTFVSPHSLHARPLVVGPNHDLAVENRTPDVAAAILIDGHRVGELQQGECVRVGLGEQRSLLATLPERTFFHRYRATFTPD